MFDLVKKKKKKDNFYLIKEHFRQPGQDVPVSVSHLTFGRLENQIIVFPSAAIVIIKSSLSGMTAVSLHFNSVSWIMKKSF